MALATLKDYLDAHNVAYVVISHSPAFTAQGIAGLVHISGKELAKTVIIKLDDKLVMAVLPAKFHVDLEALKRAANAKTAQLAAEEEFSGRFPDCETGAMPPFGNLYGLDVFVDDSLEDGQGDRVQCRNSPGADSHGLGGLHKAGRTQSHTTRRGPFR